MKSFILAAIVATGLSGPAAAENVLRWASVGGALTFDPHSVNENPTYAQVSQVYEPLVDLDSNLALVPRLAESWQLLDPLTWRFDLRRNVRFHDGTPFTSADAVFSIERARAATSEKKYYIASLKEVEAIGDHSVRITTSAPDLLLPIELRTVEIMSKVWAEEHGATLPADYAGGEETYATRHANGTGPFVLTGYEPGGRSVMERNPDWWDHERYPHNIDRVLHVPLADPKERMAALRDGEIDLLIDPPFDALDEIGGLAGWKLAKTTQLRSIFLGLDQASSRLRSSDIRDRNPFADRRVRRAMYQALDAEVIRSEVMQGLSVPAGMIISPGVNGHSAELDQRLPHDPEHARTLLVAAGFPEGFDVTLLCPIDRYINDVAICHEVARQLSAIGIRVDVEAVPKDVRGRRIRDRKTDFWLQGWGLATMDSLDVFLNFFHSRSGPFNATGYAKVEVDELIGAIQREVVTYARDALIEKAWRIVLDDIVYLPLHHQVIVWVMRDELDLPIYAGNRPLLREAMFSSAAAD